MSAGNIFFTFFYEDYPELHLIAAGSLLEFALAGLPSFGVGRIRSLFMYPFSFSEFLEACGENRLLQAINEASSENPLPEPIHDKVNEFLKRFLVVGGMPEAVSKFSENQDLHACQRILDDLIITLKADFSKYKKRVSELRLTTVFDAVVRQMGGKFVYAKVAAKCNNFTIGTEKPKAAMLR